MEKNTSLWLGLGLFGALIIASLDSGAEAESTIEPAKSDEPKTADMLNENPKEEPKKVIL